MPTKDKRFVWVDSYARWRINGSAAVLSSNSAMKMATQSRLDDILDGETRNTIAKHELIDLVRSTNRPLQVADDVAELGSARGPGRACTSSVATS